MSQLSLPQLNLPALLEEYRRGTLLLREAFNDVAPDRLHQTPTDGSWTLHQIAIHLVDSDLTGSVRMKRVACMDKPPLIGFDESAMASLSGNEKIPLALALDLFDLNRQATLIVLEALPEEAFARTGLHNEAGELNLRDLVEKFVKHLHHHLEFVEKKKRSPQG